ncbi:hypothetical protein K458DRAFT_406457 [Lentithecium fluviatile CBS 122367]|uniref:SKI-interacting protein SKIP SNW domain-containing protein n=1 Tax=Lentithecium fluviatile CBS 122367 TaxID=1168545 RepID=A0A6G1IUA9_9PLEO|nr:hypothetical protein K458DRAFT_406457 [Lentithecium fluviatile CBS 122367]
MQDVAINPRFASNAAALDMAHTLSVDEVKKRSTLQKRIAEKDREGKEARLRQLAHQARLDRPNVASRRQSSAPPSNSEALQPNENAAKRARSAYASIRGLCDNHIWALRDKPIFGPASRTAMYPRRLPWDLRSQIATAALRMVRDRDAVSSIYRPRVDAEEEKMGVHSGPAEFEKEGGGGGDSFGFAGGLDEESYGVVKWGREEKRRRKRAQM